MTLRHWAVLSMLLAALFSGCRTTNSVQRIAALPNLDPQSTSAAEKSATAPELTVATASFEQPLPSPLPQPVVVENAGLSPLSLVELEALAFENNPTLAAARARIAAAQGTRLQAGLFPNPVIGYHGTEIGNAGTAGGQGGFVSQQFITAGKLRLDQAIAGQEVVAARFDYSAQEQRLLNDIRTRFYEALTAQRRVELTRELVEIGQNLATASLSLFNSREATENDLLQAEIRAEEARILYDNAVNENIEAWRRLTAVAGVPQLPLRPLEGELAVEPLQYKYDSCFQMILATNPELDAARARVVRAEIAIERERREPVPNIDLMVSVRHQNINNSDVANVQAGLPLPLFDRNQGNIRRAQANLHAARRDVQRLELQLQDRFAVMFRRYANAQQQVRRYLQEILPRAKKSLALVTQGYETGQVEYLTLLTAQQTYLEVSLSYLDAARELQTAIAMIEGGLLSGSLAQRLDR